MKQKHFIDIENLREEDTELRRGNGYGFQTGDVIQITTKIDGSNAAFRYDEETGKLVAFSRKRELDYENTLNGFWNYIQSLNAEEYKKDSQYVIFGEWMRPHKVKYDQDFYNKWYVYDIYDAVNEQWMMQSFVKLFCNLHNLIYINELYYGPFQGWDRVRSFLDFHWHSLGEEEGVVIKNQTRLNNSIDRYPTYLKIVNEGFKESKKIREKVVDPEKEAAMDEAHRIVESVVTKNRVEKELYKMRDEGILPDKIDPKDMKLVAQNLPKRIYDDCVKEENELVIAAGEYFGKMCSSQAMKFAREIILGG